MITYTKHTHTPHTDTHIDTHAHRRMHTMYTDVLGGKLAKWMLIPNKLIALFSSHSRLCSWPMLCQLAKPTLAYINFCAVCCTWTVDGAAPWNGQGRWTCQYPCPHEAHYPHCQILCSPMSHLPKQVYRSTISTHDVANFAFSNID